MQTSEIRERFGGLSELPGRLAEAYFVDQEAISLPSVAKAYDLSQDKIYALLERERRAKGYERRQRKQAAVPERCEIFSPREGRWSWELISAGTNRPRALKTGFDSEEAARASWQEFIMLACGCDDILVVSTIATSLPFDTFWLIRSDYGSWCWELVSRERGVLAESNYHGYQSKQACREAIKSMQRRLAAGGIKAEQVEYCKYRGME